MIRRIIDAVELYEPPPVEVPPKRPCQARQQKSGSHHFFIRHFATTPNFQQRIYHELALVPGKLPYRKLPFAD